MKHFHMYTNTTFLLLKYICTESSKVESYHNILLQDLDKFRTKYLSYRTQLVPHIRYSQGLRQWDFKYGDPNFGTSVAYWLRCWSLHCVLGHNALSQLPFSTLVGTCEVKLPTGMLLELLRLLRYWRDCLQGDLSLGRCNTVLCFWLAMPRYWHNKNANILLLLL